MTQLPPFPAEPTGGSSGLPLALPGATAPTRYAGGTVSGAPVTGTFAVGDFVVDETGAIWICTEAGTPGTWVEVGGAGGTIAALTGAGIADPAGALVAGGPFSTAENTLDDGSGNATIAGALNVTGSVNATTIAAPSGDVLSLAADGGLTALTISVNGAVTSPGNNTLDDGSGDMTVVGDQTVDGTLHMAASAASIVAPASGSLAFGVEGYQATLGSDGSLTAASGAELDDGGGNLFNTSLTSEFVSVGGLTGVPARARFLGATASGAPVAGTFEVGDFVVDHTGAMWICTVAGAPGTWVQVGGAGASPQSGHLAAGLILTAAATTLVFTTGDLAPGAWAFNFTCLAEINQGAAASIDFELSAGTATATFDGATVTSIALPGAVLASPYYAAVTIAALVTVTVAGTLVVNAINGDATHDGVANAYDLKRGTNGATGWYAIPA